MMRIWEIIRNKINDTDRFRPQYPSYCSPTLTDFTRKYLGINSGIHPSNLSPIFNKSAKKI